MFSKIKDSLLILIICAIGPEVVSICRFPVEIHHRIGFILLGGASILYIFTRLATYEDIIQQVFEAKKVEVAGQYPQIVKSAK